MLAVPAALMNTDIIFLDVGEHSPAKQVVLPKSPLKAHVNGAFSDPAKIRELAEKVDVLTVEIEHVNADVLEKIQPSLALGVHPAPSTIRIIQDKFSQKQHLQGRGLPVAPFVQIESTIDSINHASQRLGLPLMIKSRTLAYDGRGNYVVRSLAQASEALVALKNKPLYCEKWVPFVKEIAVMVVRSTNGEVRSYPAVETVHKDNVCHLVFAPLRSKGPVVAERARKVAEAAISTFEGAGIFGVEMFLLADGSIYLNEIAPRPHNSGHYTIEACETSQFENHLRAILGLPLGSTALKVPSAAMLNIVGFSDSIVDIRNFSEFALTVPGATTHLYGKGESRKGRKMGHVTVVANSDAELHERLRPLLEKVPGSNPHEVAVFSPPSPPLGHSHKFPLVGVIMGSDSDLPVMLPAAHILDKFEIPYELTIVSAHRTPDRLVEYSRSAAPRGLRVVIAGAGGAAHLPGMVAAMTALPVIGVPVKGSSLDGVDSLHSIVQMPRGIPVATVAINNGTNAGLLAVRMLAVAMPELVHAMEDYLKGLEKEVLGKAETLEDVGWEEYQVKK
ncbi:Phosphoribosylaminoimidazole carboxylase [Irpex rosettiformis]|uniref:Phosphoribosylaminoimidazole carboxylase n=1 Tax=Irpex rosettiformis TaxID=378272 RepID=A0ACB8UFG4_9APHY|nr:Phosphoribosylaminoimidazole carboxylase [Irpex rosettiformis]